MKDAPDLWAHTALVEAWPVSPSVRSCCPPSELLPPPCLPSVRPLWPALLHPHPLERQELSRCSSKARLIQQQSPAEVCQRTLSYIPSLKAGFESGQPLSSSVVDPASYSPHTLLFGWYFTIRCLS